MSLYCDLTIILVFQSFDYIVTMTAIYNVGFIHNLLNQRVINVFYRGRGLASRVQWIFQVKLKVLYKSLEKWLGFFLKHWRTELSGTFLSVVYPHIKCVLYNSPKLRNEERRWLVYWCSNFVLRTSQHLSEKSRDIYASRLTAISEPIPSDPIIDDVLLK
jgi:hypothetical protein